MTLRSKGLWAALDAIAAENRMTVSALARAAGLDPTAFNKSKRAGSDGRERWPSTHSIALVLDAVNMSFVEFAALAQMTAPERAAPPAPGHHYKRRAQA